MQHPHTLLRNLLQQPVKTGHTPSMKNKSYYGDEIAFVKTDNVHDNTINNNFKDYLSVKGNALIAGSMLKKGDILTTIIGATFDVVPRSSIVLENILPANINQNIALIRVESQKIVPEFLSIYLNSKFGKTYLRYLSRQTGQINLNCREVEQLIVPLFSKKFQKLIANIVKKAYQRQNDSKSLYIATEKYLLSTLGFENFTPSECRISIKGIANSFLSSNRIDAEYYQPKYDEIERKINVFNTIKIKNLINYPVSSGITPKAGGEAYTKRNDGIPFVRAIDIINNRVELENCNYIKKEIHNGVLKRTKLKKNDVLFSIAGTVGRCGIFDYDVEANINQAVSILRFDENTIKRLYLVCYFNSFIGKLYVSKYSRQGLQTNLNLNEVSNLCVPIICYNIQQKIAVDIQHSFVLSQQSRNLLDTAKHAVEIAIEDNENKAIKYLENETINCIKFSAHLAHKVVKKRQKP